MQTFIIHFLTRKTSTVEKPTTNFKFMRAKPKKKYKKRTCKFEEKQKNGYKKLQQCFVLNPKQKQQEKKRFYVMSSITKWWLEMLQGEGGSGAKKKKNEKEYHNKNNKKMMTFLGKCFSLFKTQKEKETKKKTTRNQIL